MFDAFNVMTLVPGQQRRVEGYDLNLMPSVPLSCFVDMAELFGFGTPYDLNQLPRFPKRKPPVPCQTWLRRLGMDQKQ